MATAIGNFSTSYARYAYEATFGTAPSDASITTYFGHNVKFSATAKNNIERIPELNTRNYGKYSAKKFEGTWAADFQVSNFYWMKSLFSVATTGAGPYTHTYSEANVPTSMTIQQTEDLDTDSERTLTGCITDKMTLSFNTGDVVSGKLDGTYVKEIKDSTMNANGNGSDAEEVFTFAHATLELPTSTTLTEVQSLEISIANNSELIWGLGSRFATQRAFKQRVYEIKIGKTREADADLLDDFYGSTTTISNPNNPANIATLNLTVSNGLSTTNLRSFTMKLANLQVEDYSAPLTPGEIVKEDATLYALALDGTSKAVYTNNTASHP